MADTDTIYSADIVEEAILTTYSADAGFLSIRGLTKRFGRGEQLFTAVDGVAFDVPQGGFYTLLGESGCGKTTTLRLVAGLERPDQGEITIAGRRVSADRPKTFVPPHLRGIGMVFQSYALWPHMSVFDNVAFPLRRFRSGVSRAEIATRVGEALEMVRLSGFETRMATQMSGGQQQRLALARALVGRPSLILLDEPLSNLDAKLREEMRSEVRDLQRALGLTLLYVTHDQAEALSMSDRIAVMERGSIVQEGSPREIYDQPATRFVARFVGSANFVDGTTGDASPGAVEVLTSFGPLTSAVKAPVAKGRQVSVTIRPENVRVHAEPPARPNVFSAVVDRLVFLGDQLECIVTLGVEHLVSRLHPASPFHTGQVVFVEVPPEACAVIDEPPVRDTPARSAEPNSEATPGAIPELWRATLHEEVM